MSPTCGRLEPTSPNFLAPRRASTNPGPRRGRTGPRSSYSSWACRIPRRSSQPRASSRRISPVVYHTFIQLTQGLLPHRLLPLDRSAPDFGLQQFLARRRRVWHHLRARRFGAHRDGNPDPVLGVRLLGARVQQRRGVVPQVASLRIGKHRPCSLEALHARCELVLDLQGAFVDLRGKVAGSSRFARSGPNLVLHHEQLAVRRCGLVEELLRLLEVARVRKRRERQDRRDQKEFEAIHGGLRHGYWIVLVTGRGVNALVTGAAGMFVSGPLQEVVRTQ